MHPELLTYLNTERTGVLAIETLDGSPHGATLHFAHSSEPFVLYFETHRDSRKAEPLLSRDISRASFTIGTSEERAATCQLSGTVEILKPEEQELFQTIYLGKFPEKQEKSQKPGAVFFKFIPTWWRFSDFKSTQGKLIISSDN